MNINFEYNKDKDVWCLLNKGKSSINSPIPTKAYKQLVAFAGDNPNENNASLFIDKYLNENGFDIVKYLEECKNSFMAISVDFKKIAEKVFMLSFDKEITAYMTVNGRCPYNIEQNWFYVSIYNEPQNLRIMHEIWHFYTWYKFGKIYEQKIGKDKYNTIKEALTVLLNIVCSDLFTKEDGVDKGYPQHKELRDNIITWWKENPDIDYVFDKAVKFIS